MFDRLRFDSHDSLRTGALSTGIVGVDRAARALRGAVVCQSGVMKSVYRDERTGEIEYRGEWDRRGLEMLTALGNAQSEGIPSHFMHAAFECDGLGRFLGRVRGFRLSSTTDRTGRIVECVRGDLFLDRTALQPSPWSGGKPFGAYLLDLAESDPGAMSASIEVRALKEYRRDEKGNIIRDVNGIKLPSLWRPVWLWSVDAVRLGDACDSILRPEPTTADRAAIQRHRLARYRQMDREREQFQLEQRARR